MDIMTLVAIAAVLLAALADILTTERFLHHGYPEVWPVMKWALEKFHQRTVAIFKMVFVVGWSAAMVWLDAVWMIWLGAAFFAGLSIHNWRLVK